MTMIAGGSGYTTHYTVYQDGRMFDNINGTWVPEKEARMGHPRLADDYRDVAHDELAAAADGVTSSKPNEVARRHRIAQVHATLATDSRLAAIHAMLTSTLDKIHDEQVEQTATLHAIRDRLPEAIEPAGLTPVAGLTEPSVNVTETPDLSTEDAGTSSESADITEEPPVGSQITDCEGEVWERREGGWTLWRPGGSGWLADLYESALDPWPVVRGFAPLRPTTDEDRKRVGLPVEPAPDDVDPEPKAELDEVEALAMDLYHASLLIPPVKEIGPTTWLSERDHEMWLGVARAARKHIGHEVQMDNARALADMRVRADRVEADLARVTKERDRLTHLLGSHADGHRCTCEMTDPGKPGIEPPTWEQDPWCLTHPDLDMIAAERNERTRDAIKWRLRHSALREDVDRFWRNHRRDWTVMRGLGDALDRDTERAES